MGQCSFLVKDNLESRESLIGGTQKIWQIPMLRMLA